MIDPLEYNEAEGQSIGRDPRRMSKIELTALGHPGGSVLKAIRKKCIDCSGGSEAETRRCTVATCALWPYRMRTNPFREAREMSDEQRAAAAERLGRARTAKLADEDEDDDPCS